jgi:hypothetical protein
MVHTSLRIDLPIFLRQFLVRSCVESETNSRREEALWAQEGIVPFAYGKGITGKHRSKLSAT